MVVNYASRQRAPTASSPRSPARAARPSPCRPTSPSRPTSQRLFAETKKAFGRLDILVNNAGIYEFAPLEERHARALPQAVRPQRARADPGVAGGGQALRPRGRQHHQHQLGGRDFAPPGSYLGLQRHQGRRRRGHPVARQGAGPAQDPRQLDQPRHGRNRRRARRRAIAESDFRKQIEAQTPLGRIGQPRGHRAGRRLSRLVRSAWITGETFYHRTGDVTCISGSGNHAIPSPSRCRGGGDREASLFVHGWLPSLRAQPPDAVAAAQTSGAVPVTRPEQHKSAHDTSNLFEARHAEPSSPVLASHRAGRHARVRLLSRSARLDAPDDDASTSDQKPTSRAKPGVMAAQRKLLESRYDLTPRTRSERDDVARQAAPGRPHGPPARRHELGRAGRDEPGDDPRQGRPVPLPAAAAPKQAAGGRSSPRCRSRCSRGCSASTWSSTLPDAFLPEFPPAIFLQTRPELGDVSRGEVVSINNYYRLFKDILTPVQLDGLRLLLTPFPQEEFNPTDDRKSARAEPGRHLPRLPRQRPHHRPVPPEPGRPARSSAASGSTR